MIEKPQWRGEPAFPQYSLVAEGVFCEGGMTLRDYFAAKAMQGELASQSPENEYTNLDALAVLSYRTADAMLKARNGNP
jgi:hypothetical protein